jgi:hypothetical protein
MPTRTTSPERTVTLAIPVALDRALERIGARHDWTKKRVVAWALAGRAVVRNEVRVVEAEQNGRRK